MAPNNVATQHFNNARFWLVNCPRAINGSQLNPEPFTQDLGEHGAGERWKGKGNESSEERGAIREYLKLQTCGVLA